jgi:hypothetical protein
MLPLSESDGRIKGQGMFQMIENKNNLFILRDDYER